MDSKEHGLTYKSAVMSFLFRLTENTVTKKPIDNTIDTLWGYLNSVAKEKDHRLWRRYARGRDYASTMWKVRILFLLLYRINVLPQKPNIKNRQFKDELEEERVELRGLQSWVVEDLELANWINRHIIYHSYIDKRQMDASVHIDLLWFVLSPYVDEEAYSDWELINAKFMDKNSPRHSIYEANVEKVKVISNVLYRADFQFGEAHEDSPNV